MPAKLTKIRTIALVAAAGSVAASGYFMQAGHKTPVQTAGIFSAPVQAPATETPAVATAEAGPTAPPAPGLTDIHVPDAPAIDTVTRADLTPILALPERTEHPAAEPLMAAASTQEAPLPPAPMVAEPQLAGSCETGFTALAEPGAMVALTLESPCRAGETADFFHAGLRFTVTLDENGLAQTVVPALTENAVFSAEMGDGETISTEILMFTVADYERVGLSWKGQEGFDLYALEGGAAYGEDGHVSITHPFGPDRALADEGGFLTSLGETEDGYHAAVYSWPLRLTDTDPLPQVSIEASVTPFNCAREISATFLRAVPGAEIRTDTLIMAVPGCDAIGDFLVLKNLPRDRKLALN